MRALSRLSAGAAAAALATLAWIGIDPVALATGRDLGAGFQPSYLLLATALGLAAISQARVPRARPGSWSPWPWLAIAALGAAALSAGGLLLAPPAGIPLDVRFVRFLKQFIQLIIMIAFMSYYAEWAKGGGRWALARRLTAAGLLVQLAWSLAQVATFGHAPAWFVAAERLATSNPAILAGSEELFLGNGFTGLPRVRGTACEPLYLANYVLMALPVLLLPGARKAHRWLAVGAAALLLGTWSRGAWLAAAVGGVVWAVLARRARLLPRPGRRALAVLAVAVAVAVAAALLRPDFAALPWRRLAQSFSREDWSNLTRLYSMQAAWRAWLLSPLLGVGWGQFAFHFPALVDPTGLQSQFSWPVVNSLPLAILCETGLPGFAVFAVAATLLARASWSAAGRGAGAEHAARVALLAAGTAAVWAQLLTFSQYNLPHVWVAPGLLLAALRAEREGAHA